jgi:hypothetical protein
MVIDDCGDGPRQRARQRMWVGRPRDLPLQSGGSSVLFRKLPGWLRTYWEEPAGSGAPGGTCMLDHRMQWVGSSSTRVCLRPPTPPPAGSWRGLEEELATVQALSPEDVRAVAERVFAPSNCFTGYVLKAQA